jgi:inner membrane protein
MQGKTHMLAGMLAGVLIAVDPVAVIAGGIGGLLPDLDHPRSRMSRAAGVFALPIHLAVRHRGVLHSGLCWLILAFFSFYLMREYPQYGIALLAATAGYLTHLALDSLTVSGIPLLWPSGRRFSAIPLRTGGVGEAYVATALVAAIALRIGLYVGLL